MPLVRFTPHLRRFFPDLDDVEVEGETVAEVVRALEALHPGLAAYLVDEHGALRPHVNVFVGERAIRDRRALGDALTPTTQLFVLQALSGG